jgi:hypothetical protein
MEIGMKRAIACMVLLLATSACSANDPGGGGPPARSSSAVSLRDSCPRVKAAELSIHVSSVARWQAFSARLAAITDVADDQTRSALRQMREAAATLATVSVAESANVGSRKPQGSAPLRGVLPMVPSPEQSVTMAYAEFALRCQAVGA